MTLMPNKLPSIKHVVGFSGGIDSQATLRYVREKFGDKDTIAVNSTTGGNESPTTEYFIESYSRDVFPVVRVIPLVKDIWRTPGWAETKGFDGDEPLTFERMAQIKGRWPSRKAQFCSSIMKVFPTVRWHNKEFGVNGKYTGWDYERYVGIRADESAERSTHLIREYDETFDCWLNRPILHWSKGQCFDYVKQFGEPINPLYTLGFKRVGCAPCVNSDKEDIANWARREPEMIDKIAAWEKLTGRTFFYPGIVPGKKVVSVGEVVLWSFTKHGGKKYDFDIINNAPAKCSSKYGLCE